MKMNDLVHNEERLKQLRERAKELIGQMTLEEKVYQTLYNAPAIERLGIASYNWWNEALHGVARAGTATVFPQAIGLAATFDEDFMEQIGDAVSTEARAKFNMQQEFGDHDIYKGLTFWAPNVNIFRDPRWGRGHETFGEDPYLTSRLGVRYIEGMQGHDEKYLKTAACAKHFAVHSGPEGMRHYFNAEVSKKDLYETYLPAFKACVQEGKVEAVMGAYNRTNGEPCCGSKTLLKDILRDEWGFEGHVTSDCWAIKDFYEGHNVTKNAEESVALAMNNGCDLNCGTLFVYLLDAVRDGLVKEERLDEALVNLFTTRMKLGVFDKADDNPYNKISYSVVDSPKMQELNLTAAKRCLTLLKNDQMLPLDKEKIHTIGVIGPNADNRMALVGNYEGTASRYVTVLEGLEDYAKEHPRADGEKMRIVYSEGCHLYKDRSSNLTQSRDRFAEVKGVCKESDVVVVCLGLDASHSNIALDEINTVIGYEEMTNSFAFGSMEILSWLVFLFGVINLINTTLSNQIARKQENSILRSIGLTQKQLCKMNICEGLCYALFATLATLIVGLPASIFACRKMSIGAFAGNVVPYKFPVLEMGLFILVLFGMELILSVWTIRRQKKQSLIEQMRAME